MFDMNSRKPDFDSALSGAIRELARSSPRTAPPELRNGLIDAFHRHHRRRRLVLASSLLLAAVAVFGSSVWLLRGTHTVPPPRPMIVAAGRPIDQPNVAQKAIEPTQSGEKYQRPRKATRSRPRPKRPSSGLEPALVFLELPPFALRTPNEPLRVVQVEMPASSLRLLGAQVSGELIHRRVNADLLVGPDGTPYAVRVVF